LLDFAVLFWGMHGSIPLSTKTFRNQSLSYPRLSRKTEAKLIAGLMGQEADARRNGARGILEGISGRSASSTTREGKSLNYSVTVSRFSNGLVDTIL
jgi:hypothetical protein